MVGPISAQLLALPQLSWPTLGKSFGDDTSWFHSWGCSFSAPQVWSGWEPLHAAVITSKQRTERIVCAGEGGRWDLALLT